MGKIWNYLTRETYRVKIKKWTKTTRYMPQVKYGIFPMWFNFSCGEYDLVHVFEEDAWETIHRRQRDVHDMRYLGTSYKYEKG